MAIPSEPTTPNDPVLLLGRVLLGAIFVLAAPRHFTQEAIHHAADFGVPLAAALVPLSGVMAVAGGLGVLVGFRTKLGVALLLAFLVPVTCMMHPFWHVAEAREAHVQLAMFIKNVSIAGGLLVLGQIGPGRFSLDARRRGSNDRA